jgi:cytochrome P450 family 3 subfamily A
VYQDLFQTNPDFLQLLLNTIRNKEPSTASNLDDDNEICHAALNQASRRVEITDMELVGQTALFIAAGFETTATTLQFIAYLLAMHPEIQEKCFEEIQDALGEKVRQEILINVLVISHFLNQIRLLIRCCRIS